MDPAANTPYQINLASDIGGIFHTMIEDIGGSDSMPIELKIDLPHWINYSHMDTIISLKQDGITEKTTYVQSMDELVQFMHTLAYLDYSSLDEIFQTYISKSMSVIDSQTYRSYYELFTDMFGYGQSNKTDRYFTRILLYGIDIDQMKNVTDIAKLIQDKNAFVYAPNMIKSIIRATKDAFDREDFKYVRSLCQSIGEMSDKQFFVSRIAEFFGGLFDHKLPFEFDPKENIVEYFETVPIDCIYHDCIRLIGAYEVKILSATIVHQMIKLEFNINRNFFDVVSNDANITLVIPYTVTIDNKYCGDLIAPILNSIGELYVNNSPVVTYSPFYKSELTGLDVGVKRTTGT